MRRLCFVPILIALCSDATGEPWPTLSLRNLAIEADIIVIGEPIDSKPDVVPNRYRVIEVLKGAGLTPGTEILVPAEREYRMRRNWWRAPRDDKQTERITRALLFLRERPDRDPESGYRTVCSGIRPLTEDGGLLLPVQAGMIPGPFIFLLDEEGSWDAMLKEVRNDLPKIARVVGLRGIEDRSERNKAVFTWIESHREEFGGGWNHGQKGWASLESDVFEWIMESCIPEDCWRAIELYTEIGTRPEKFHPSFCSPKGRELLMAKVFDEEVPEPLRLIALGKLGGNIRTLRRDYPGIVAATGKERRAIIGRVLPLLGNESASWRTAAIRCLSGASRRGANQSIRLAVPALAALYGTERDASVREVLVGAILRLEDDAFWEELSGNPQGIAVLLYSPAYRGGVMRFWMNLEHTRATITEPPRFWLQRLDASGKIRESRLVDPVIRDPDGRFERGWRSHHGAMEVTIPTSGLVSGLWRVTAEGTVGKPKARWRSEPVEIEIP